MDWYFKRRFDEIFLQEKLKEELIFTDRISNKIAEGDIYIGMSSEELLLTLGKPFDIVTLANSETEQEEWVYKEDQRTYHFIFESKQLVEWIGH